MGALFDTKEAWFPKFVPHTTWGKIQYRDCRLSRSRADKQHCPQSSATMYPIVLGSQMGRYQHTKDLPHIINIDPSFASSVGGLLQSHKFGPSPLFHSSMEKQTSITTSFLLTFWCKYNFWMSHLKCRQIIGSYSWRLTVIFSKQCAKIFNVKLVFFLNLYFI